MLISFQMSTVNLVLVLQNNDIYSSFRCFGKLWSRLISPCISHLFHTVPWTAWRPASAQEPAWSAAATTSGADSQNCTWNSVRQLFWIASRGPPNPSTSYLGGMGCNMGNITFPVLAAGNTSAVFHLSSLCVVLLEHPLQIGIGDTWAIILVT